MLKEGIIDKETFVAKLNFASYIDRFERENMNVIEFASAIPYKEKIEILTQIIYDYAKADINKTTAGSTAE